MNRNDFQNLISQKILLLDGATGTALAKAGMPAGVCVEQWALEHPQVLAEIQKKYYEAGSDAVYTCTFGANGAKLSGFGIEESESLNYELAQLTKQIAPDKLTGGSIGPTGEMAVPFGIKTAEDFRNYFLPQIKGLFRGGVDFLVFETMIDIRELRFAILTAKEVCDLPIVATLSVDEQGKTLGGTPFETALVTLTSLGADAVGLNCSCGPEEMLKLLENAKQYAAVPLVAKPNAGLPEVDENGNTRFTMEASAFSSYAKRFAEAGVCLTGGCCGTDDSFIRAVAQKLKGIKPTLPDGSVEQIITSARTIYQVDQVPDEVIKCDEFLADTVMDEYMDSDCLVIKADKMEDADAIDQLTGMVNIPLIFDCENDSVLREILKRYPGRAGVINGEASESAKEFGALLC